MPKQETSQSGGPAVEDGLPASEASLGKALALIHHALPLLDQTDRAKDVQAALQKASAFVETARQAHARERGLVAAVPVQSPPTAEAADAEIVAVIAAAVAALIDRPHRVVSVISVELPPHLNVWAFEGRTQLFMSHRVR